MQRLQSLDPGQISFCNVQLRTVCAACSLATSFLFTTSRSGFGVLPGFRGSMVSHHASISRTGSGNSNNKTEVTTAILTEC